MDTNQPTNPPVGGQVFPASTEAMAGNQAQPTPAPAPQPRRGLPKPLIILAVILVVLLLGFAAFQFLLPRLGGKEASLTWWGFWEESVVTPLIGEYQQANPNVKIQYIKQSRQDYRERLTNSLARGTGGGAPDIFSFHNSWAPMFTRELSVIPDSVMTSQEYTSAFYPIAQADLRTAEGLVGVPLSFDSLALFINNDIFTTAGKSPPRTWDELKPLALELTVKDATGAVQQGGIAMGNTKNVDYWPEIIALMMLQNKVSLSEPQGNRAQNTLIYYSQFQALDHVWDETLPLSTTAFANGKLAMYFGTSSSVAEIKKLNPGLNFSVVPVPQLPKDIPTEPNVTYATYWAQGVSRQSANGEEAWKFIKFLSSQESLKKLSAPPYPRPDMANLLASDKWLNAFALQAPDAQSWYLQSKTFDGATGINTQVNSVYEAAVNAMTASTSGAEQVLEALRVGIATVLSQYGLAAPPATTGQ